jgi:hypothetical protein
MGWFAVEVIAPAGMIAESMLQKLQGVFWRLCFNDSNVSVVVIGGYPLVLDCI